MLFSELTAEDIRSMDRQREIVSLAASAYGGWPTASSTSARANTLQVLIDEAHFLAEQTFELQALGVAFGDILCDEGPFRWAIITDEYGRDPTVRWKSTETNINALTIISKRVEAGRPIIISELLDWCHRTALAKDGNAE